MFWGWKTGAICAKNRNGPDVASNERPALDITHLEKETRMPVKGNITASGDSASVEHQDNWNSIGELAKALAEKAGRK